MLQVRHPIRNGMQTNPGQLRPDQDQTRPGPKSPRNAAVRAAQEDKRAHGTSWHSLSACPYRPTYSVHAWQGIRRRLPRTGCIDLRARTHWSRSVGLAESRGNQSGQPTYPSLPHLGLLEDAPLCVFWVPTSQLRHVTICGERKEEGGGASFTAEPEPEPEPEP